MTKEELERLVELEKWFFEEKAKRKAAAERELYNRCEVCGKRKKAVLESRRRRREKDKDYKKRNIERIKAYNKRYRAAHHTERMEYQRQYRERKRKEEEYKRLLRKFNFECLSLEEKIARS